jgi:hypothetical protein
MHSNSSRFKPFVSSLVLTVTLVACGGDPVAEPGSQQPLVTPIAEAVGEPIIKTIGSVGGSLSTSDGFVTIIVPAGAVASDTQFTLQKTSDTLGGGVGAGFKLLPHNLEVAVPLRVRVQIDNPSGVPASELRLALQDSAGQWYGTSTVLSGAPRITAVSSQQVTDYDGPLPILTLPKPVQPKEVVNLGLWIKATVSPQTTQVPKGQTRRFQIPGIYDACTSTGGVEPPVTTFNLCLFQNPRLTATAGTLKRIDAINYEYTAPTSIPSPNPVLLGFTFSKIGKDGKSEITLPATVTITDQNEISGTFKQTISYKKSGGTEPYSISVNGTLTMKYVDGLAGPGYGRGEGTMTVAAYKTTTKTQKSPNWTDTTVCETDAITYKVRTVGDDFSQNIDLTDDGKGYKTSFSIAPLSGSEPKPTTVCTRKYSHNGDTGTEVTTTTTIIYPDFSSLGTVFAISAPGSFIGVVERETDALTSSGSWDLQQ